MSEQKKLVMSGSPKSRRPTSHDVAQLAGVSQPTVSLVFSGRARDIGISKATEDRVMAAARELSYVPNKLMRSIRNHRTGILGVYGPGQQWSMRHSYWAEVLTAIHEGASQLEQELLFFSPRKDKPIDDVVHRILSGVVDGVIVQPGVENTVLDRLIEAQFPVVTVGDPYRHLPCVTLENAHGTKTLVQHLYQLGHRKFAYLRVEAPDSTEPFPNLAAEIRPKAFSDAIRELGLSPEKNPQIHIGKDAEFAVNRVLELGADAVLCHHDECAYPFVQELKKRGIRMPEDIAVTGFDGIPIPFVPAFVTTIQSPIPEMGRRAVEKLKRLVEGTPFDMVTTLPVSFVKGDTT